MEAERPRLSPMDWQVLEPELSIWAARAADDPCGFADWCAQLSDPFLDAVLEERDDLEYALQLGSWLNETAAQDSEEAARELYAWSQQAPPIQVAAGRQNGRVEGMILAGATIEMALAVRSATEMFDFYTWCGRLEYEIRYVVFHNSVARRHFGAGADMADAFELHKRHGAKRVLEHLWRVEKETRDLCLAHPDLLDIYHRGLIDVATQRAADVADFRAWFAGLGEADQALVREHEGLERLLR